METVADVHRTCYARSDIWCLPDSNAGARTAGNLPTVTELAGGKREALYHMRLGISLKASDELCTPLQACYGHTEGTAGITGLLLAACALQEASTVPIVNLRDVNPYVAAAIGDMKHMSAHAPRQLAPGMLLVATQAELLTVAVHCSCTFCRREFSFVICC